MQPQVFEGMSNLQLYFDDTSFNIQYSPMMAWADNSSDVWTGGRSKVVTQFPGAQLTFTFNGNDLPAYHRLFFRDSWHE
jgi:hypothetical protein